MKGPVSRRFLQVLYSPSLDIVSHRLHVCAQVTAAEVTEAENGTKSVTIVSSLNHVNEDSIEEVFCFYRKAKNLKGGLMTDAKFVGNKNQIDCGVFKPNGGGVYQFGILLTQSKRSLK